jgi:hypothetical protein
VSIAGSNRELQCGSSYYSATSPTLTAGAGTKDSVFNALFPLQDTAGDAAPSPANVLKLSFDLGGCLRANNVDASQPIRLALTAVDESRPGGTDRTSLTLAACLPGCTLPSQGPGPQNGDGGTQQQGGGTQTQGGKPDLAVDSVTGVTNSGNCDLTITIANRGTATAPPSTTGVAVGGGASTTYQAQSVDAGGHVQAAGTISGPCAGQNLTVTADAPNAIDEFAEDNNIWQGTL